MSNVNGKAHDDPEYSARVRARNQSIDVSTWMHPARSVAGLWRRSEIEIRDLWQVLGWAFETSVAMSRMVYSGFFPMLPELLLITHHRGAMMP